MSYHDYIHSLSLIDKSIFHKLMLMYYKVKHTDLPYNYILYKSLQLLGHDFSNIEKVNNIDKINYYDNIWNKIAWNNDWLTCNTISLCKSSIKSNKYDIYNKYYINEVKNENVPIDIQNELIKMFDLVWNVYISKYSEYKFVSCDFMIRKLIQNIGQPQYLKCYSRKITNIETLTKFEELWKCICNNLQITYF